MDLNLTREQREIKMAARGFAEGEFRDVARACDGEEKTNLEALKNASELGFVGLFIDEKYGGAGSIAGSHRGMDTVVLGNDSLFRELNDPNTPALSPFEEWFPLDG